MMIEVRQCILREEHWRQETRINGEPRDVFRVERRVLEIDTTAESKSVVSRWSVGHIDLDIRCALFKGSCGQTTHPTFRDKGQPTQAALIAQQRGQSPHDL